MAIGRKVLVGRVNVLLNLLLRQVADAEHGRWGALAVVHGLVLATGNVEHYERIRAVGYDVEIDNWREGPS